MNDGTIFTLKEFIDIFGGIEQIHSMFVDTDDDSIRNQLQGNLRPLDILHNYKNIMDDDEYLVLCNGDYVLNKEKIFETYGDYYVSMYFPVIPPEYVKEANELANGLPDREYLCHIAKYSNGVEILIKKTLDFNIKLEKAYDPDIHSTINGLLILDYYEFPKEIADHLAGIIPSFNTVPVGVVSDENEMFDVLKQRITLDSMVYEFKNGILQRYRLYHTDKDGVVTEIVEREEPEAEAPEDDIYD